GPAPSGRRVEPAAKLAGQVEVGRGETLVEVGHRADADDRRDRWIPTDQPGEHHLNRYGTQVRGDLGRRRTARRGARVVVVLGQPLRARVGAEEQGRVRHQAQVRLAAHVVEQLVGGVYVTALREPDARPRPQVAVP